MKKLTKTLLREKESLLDRLDDKREDVKDRINELNERMSALYSEVEDAVIDYNEALAEVRAFVSRVTEKMKTHFDTLSPDSPKSDAYSEMLTRWEDFVPDDIEVEAPSEVDLPEMDDVQQEFEGLPEEPTSED